jgi:DTW domain-containing protein YfiP
MQSAKPPVIQPIELILLTHATEFDKKTNTGALVAPALAGFSHITVSRKAWSRVAPDPALCLPSFAKGFDHASAQASAQLSEQASAQVNAQVIEQFSKHEHADATAQGANGILWLLYPSPQAVQLSAEKECSADDFFQPLQSTQGNGLTERSSAIDSTQSALVHRFILLDATWQLAHKMYRQSPYLQQLPSIMLQSTQPSTYLLRKNQRQHGWCTAESVVLLLKAIGQNAASHKLSEAFHLFNQRK